MRVLFLILLSITAGASEMKTFSLHIKNAKFEPNRLIIPADEKVKIEVINEGPGAEEFESLELNREKVVLPGQSIQLFIGPLSKGEYKFFGDFHKDTAQGVLVAQ